VQPSVRICVAGPEFRLADALRDFELAGFSLRYPVPELAWHRLFVARTYRVGSGVVDGEDPELLKSGSQWLCVAAMQ
jgi:hypothetical protein